MSINKIKHEILMNFPDANDFDLNDHGLEIDGAYFSNNDIKILYNEKRLHDDGIDNAVLEYEFSLGMRY